MTYQPEGQRQATRPEDPASPEASQNPSSGINAAHRQSFKVGGTKNGQPVNQGAAPVNQTFSQVTTRFDLPDTAENQPSPKESPNGGQAKVIKETNMRQGTRPGDRYVKILRTTQADVQRIAPKYVQLLPDELKNQGAWGRFKRFLIGRPIETAQSHHERLNKLRALAVFASDALSSVAYATEATLFVLVTANSTSQPISYVIPISLAICILIALVVNSYRQTVVAYPNGGGSYIVSKDNLGVNFGLVAAAAILIDYTLTVAVSVAAGVQAIVSIPTLSFLGENVVPLGVGLIFLIMLANLRGIRESGTIFAIPTYLFILSFLGLLAFGVFKILTGDYQPYTEIKPATREIAGFASQQLSIFLLLQAFAAGCAALTGTEAISDGVQAFKKPESKNAAQTLIAMGALLIIFFMGTSFLANTLNALPDEATASGYETVISKIGRNLIGADSIFYWVIQLSTALILILAANTAFADFPRLAFFLARDKFLPNIFGYRGDRLAFTTGIVVLAVLASTLLAVFGGHTEKLIPLYAVGVFLAFTLSQSGMILHWQKKKRLGIQGVTRNQIFNAMGAIATGIVLVIIVFTKFLEGAWLVVILIPMIFWMFKLIHRHYTHVNEQLRLPEKVTSANFVQNLPINGSRSHTIIVPISRVNKVSLMTLDFARSLGDSVTALFISDEPEAVEGIIKDWKDYELKLPLVVLESPFRSIIPPLLNYIDKVDSGDEDDILMVVLPEFVARHWWELLLHNQTALRIKRVLLFKPGVVVVDVPYHLRRRGDTEEVIVKSF